MKVIQNTDSGVVLGGSDRSTVSRSRLANNGGIGLYLALSDQSRVTNNRVLDNADWGILDRASETEISHNTISGNDIDGIEASGSDNLIEDNVVTLNGTPSSNSFGIDLDEDSRDAIVRNNTVTDQVGGGIQLEGRSDRIIDNVVNDNAEGGIDALGEYLGRVSSNVLKRNGSFGVRSRGSNEVRFLNNTIRASSDCFVSTEDPIINGDSLRIVVRGNSISDCFRGMDLSSGTIDALVEDNEVSDNVFGIEVNGASGTQLISNTANRNSGILGGSDGIFIGSSSANTFVKGNRTFSNSDSGIGAGSASTTVTKNVANDNARYGIEGVAGVTDGGGNKAKGNGVGQCVNVACS